jgi:hypothetical protein
MPSFIPTANTVKVAGSDVSISTLTYATNFLSMPGLHPAQDVIMLTEQTCCSTSERGQSASFRAIPDWYVETRSYREPGCDERWRSYANWNGKRDGSYFCNSLGNYHSVGYGILGRKREEGGVAPSECEKPNAMGLEDGTQYNLTAMDDTLVGELLGYKEAKGAADIPELFQEFVM